MTFTGSEGKRGGFGVSRWRGMLPSIGGFCAALRGLICWVVLNNIMILGRRV